MPAKTENLKFQGYETIVPNSIYGKELKSDENPMGIIPLAHIMSMTKYSVPSEDEIIDLIRSDAKTNFSRLGEHLAKEVSAEINLREILEECISPKEMGNIINGEEKTISHLKSHYSQDFQQGKTYISVVHGIIPSMFLNLEKYRKNEMVSMLFSQFKENEKYQVMEKLMEKNMKKECILEIRLDNNSLPDKKEMKYLLDREVRDCNLFKIKGRYEYDKAAGQIHFLYDSLKSSEKIGKITDISGKFLKEKAAETVSTFAMCVAKAKEIEKIGDYFGNPGSSQRF